MVDEEKPKKRKRAPTKDADKPRVARKKPKKEAASEVPLEEDEGRSEKEGSTPADEGSIEAQEENQEFYELLQKNDALPLAQAVYQLWQGWADFELTILQPTLPEFSPPQIVMPDSLPNSHELEFVYPIHDYGYKFLTSKQDEMFSAGKSMCKLYYTIEKIIALLIERLKSENIDPDTEVQAAFGGHECAQRKGFEVVINLKYNVVIINFDPGPWGERYLKIVKNLSDLGYGYPPEAPRTPYRQHHGSGNIKPS